MGQFICRFDDTETNKSYYLMWSTVVDAPVSCGMERAEFFAYYRREYGRVGMDELGDRMKRVELFGTSSRVDKDLRSLIVANRAGEGETELSYEEILRVYCLRLPAPTDPAKA